MCSALQSEACEDKLDIVTTVYISKVILYESYDFVSNLYPYSSRFALVSDAHASYEGRGRALAPQAGLGGRLHRGQRSPSPGKQREH